MANLMTPASKVQIRVIDLFELPEDDGTYINAAGILSAAGLPADGCPKGLDWRAVKKLSDEQLRSALPTPTTSTEHVATANEIAAQQRAFFVQRRADFNKRSMAEYAPREEQEYLDNLLPATFASHPHDERHEA